MRHKRRETGKREGRRQRIGLEWKRNKREIEKIKSET